MAYSLNAKDKTTAFQIIIVPFLLSFFNFKSYIKIPSVCVISFGKNQNRLWLVTPISFAVIIPTAPKVLPA